MRDLNCAMSQSEIDMKQMHEPVPSAEERVRASLDWLWFCSSLVEKVEKVARISLTNQRATQSKAKGKAKLLFDTQLKTTLNRTRFTFASRWYTPFKLIQGSFYYRSR